MYEIDTEWDDAMENNTASKQDLYRVEKKIDKLAQDITNLVILEERQNGHSSQIERLTETLTDLSKSHYQLKEKVDKWINIGYGGITVASVLWAVVQFIIPLLQVHHG